MGLRSAVRRRRDGERVQGSASSSSASAIRTPTIRPRLSASLTICSTVERAIFRPARARPWIGVGSALFVDEDAVARFPRLFLQRQGDQVAESALGQRVLVGKEAVVGIEADLRPALHGFGEQVGAEPPCQGGGNGLGEEQPDMAAVAGARPFQEGRHVKSAAGGEQGRGVFSPMVLSKSAARKKHVSSWSIG